jgi:integrase
MTYNQSSYIRVRFGIYHFIRRVPADVKQHYRSDRVTISLRTNSASAALNKWMKTAIGNGYVMHGLRHSLRNRLRAVECPSDIIDAIGGWTTTGIGHAYGKGSAVEIMAKWMQNIER